MALGIGLLLGLERERRKGAGPSRAPAGVRTFALVALLGGTCVAVGGVTLAAVGLAFVAAASLIAYAFSDRSDPGLTTEVALPVTFLLGALAQEEPSLAAGVAVVVAILLATKQYLHRFARDALTEQEVHDGLLLGAAALVALPLVPDEDIGPYGAFNPFTIWRLVVLVMLIGALGYIALRVLGPRVGLPVAGFAAGFVSSSATIASMGARARKEPGIRSPAIAAAVLSSVATVIQLLIVVSATDRGAAREIALPMAFAGVAAVAYGAVFGVRAWRADGDTPAATGRAFEPKTAVIFAGTVAGILLLSAALNDVLGESGVSISAGAAGFADAHSAAISVAALVATGHLRPEQAVVPILVGFTSNSVTKAVLAWTSGDRQFAFQVWPGLLLVLVAAWAGWGVGRSWL